MTRSHNRRQFLENSAAGLTFLSALPNVSRAEASVDSKLVRLDSGIEPLVRLIEETPRQKLLEEVAHKIQGGTTYREVLAALLCAGVRNVQPRPSVGFKFHCVLVVNSCHLASLHGPDEDRWLPIFWALDYFKDSQADEARQSGWHMQAVDEARVPSPDSARGEFITAMNAWDVEHADAATAGIVRHLDPKQVFELYAEYAARDYRSIGHKAIFLANGWRALNVIGWEHAEPVLRSLTFALLNHSGESNPATHQHKADAAWRVNEQLADRLPENWQAGKLDSGFTKELIAGTRSSDPEAISQIAMKGLESGVGPQSVWDGVFVGAMELLMRQPGIIGLHGLTTANAVRFIYDTTQNESLKRKLVLQACSFNPYFLESAQGRGRLSNIDIQSWQQQESDATPTLNSIMELISRDKMKASVQVHEYLDAGANPEELIDAARRQIFLRGRNAHDYKYSSAVLEDFQKVSNEWRNRYLALSVFNLRGSQDQVSPLVERTRSALS